MNPFFLIFILHCFKMHIGHPPLCIFFMVYFNLDFNHVMGMNDFYEDLNHVMGTKVSEYHVN